MNKEILASSSFSPNFLFQNGDLQTILSSTVRPIAIPSYKRKRISTPDDDFIDLDFVRTGSKRLAILLHGLEGCSKSKYICGMSHAFERAGYDIAAFNFRGCSGGPNVKPYSYHSGSSNDLRTVVDHVLKDEEYDSISLVGFSLGGNVLLKYLGEESSQLSSKITGAVALSVPVDLEGCAYKLALKRNQIYMKRFLRLLKVKITRKAEMFPTLVSVEGFHQLKSFADFDGRYIAPLNGFRDALDYWTQSSSLPLLSQIRVPTVLLNASDDPFLSPSCFPEKIAKQSSYFNLWAPKRGGHVGFFEHPWKKEYWSEREAVRFLNEASGNAIPLTTSFQELQFQEDRVL